MQNSVVIILMNISCGKMIDRIINNSICTIFWSNMYMVSIREEIIPNPLFWSSGLFLYILSVYRNVDSGDTGEVSLIGP